MPAPLERSFPGGVQAPKALITFLGNGVLHSGGDAKLILFTHILSSYGPGLPAALLFAIVLKLEAQSVLATRASRAGKNDEFSRVKATMKFTPNEPFGNQC